MKRPCSFRDVREEHREALPIAHQGRSTSNVNCSSAGRKVRVAYMFREACHLCCYLEISLARAGRNWSRLRKRAGSRERSGRGYKGACQNLLGQVGTFVQRKGDVAYRAFLCHSLTTMGGPGADACGRKLVKLVSSAEFRLVKGHGYGRVHGYQNSSWTSTSCLLLMSS